MTTPLLKIQNLRAGYGRAEVLHGIDLQAGVGSVITVIGPNGAGKSTLMKVLSGMVVPDGGSAQIDGHHLNFGHPRHSRRAGLGIMFDDLVAAFCTLLVIALWRTI